MHACGVSCSVCAGRGPTQQELPFSRTLEEEADHVALILLAKACIDPAIAPTVLQALADMGGWSMLTVSGPPPCHDRPRSRPWQLI
jgi:predicted Zn-dependent protease